MMNKLIVIIAIIAVVSVGYLFYPSEPNDTIMFETSIPNESKIVVGDVELLVSNDDIIPITIIDVLLSEPPDITIPLNSELPLTLLNEVQYSFEEDIIDDEITVNNYEITTTITYNDGSVINQSSFIDLQSLDFLTLDGNTKEFDNGKISFKLSVPISKQIRLAQSEFTVSYIDSNNNVKTIKNIFNTKSQSDVKDDMIIFLDDDVQFSSILNSSPLGTNKLVVTLDKLFIVYNDNSREYANPNTIYSATIEKSNSQSIIATETGNIRVWDSDIPLSISTNTQSVTAETCVTSSSTGCTQYYQSYYKVTSPKLGQITITNLDTNIEIVRTDIISESSCINKLNSEINLCESVGDGTKFTFMLQRDTQYKVEVGSPQNESFIINTPETDDTYNYTTLTTTTQTALPQEKMTQSICSTFGSGAHNGVSYKAKSPTASDSYYHNVREVTVKNLDVVKNSHIPMEDGGVCKVKSMTGHGWWQSSWRTVTVPIEYEYSEQLSSNFP